LLAKQGRYADAEENLRETLHRHGNIFEPVGDFRMLVA
jgi:hypothetical protein